MIGILFDFVAGAWGGGNQFLKALRDYLVRAGLYQDDPFAAEAVIVNSHHKIREALELRRRRPGVRIIHRVDGPVSLIRGDGPRIDKRIFRLNAALADGTIFQSEWSKARCHELGLAGGDRPSVTILNAADPTIFHPPVAEPPSRGRIRVIATSWSANANKGFATYQFLDQALDASRYEFRFVGNAPTPFRHATLVPALPSAGLAEELRSADIFLTASRNDPCSNSLIEALSCGLPAVALADGGHPEIVGGSGLLFRSDQEALAAIETVAGQLPAFRARVRAPAWESVGAQYVGFIRHLLGASLPDRTVPFAAGASLQLSQMRFFNRWW